MVVFHCFVSLPEGNRQIASFPQVHPEHKNTYVKAPPSLSLEKKCCISSYMADQWDHTKKTIPKRAETQSKWHSGTHVTNNKRNSAPSTLSP